MIENTNLGIHSPVRLNRHYIQNQHHASLKRKYTKFALN
jgi:hypothetical protein